MSLDIVALVGGQSLAASRIEVTEQIGEPTTYRVQCALQWTEGEFPQLADAALGPDAMLTLGTTVSEISHALCHGPIYGHSVHYAHGGGGTLELVGGDEALLMDREVIGKAWPDGAVDGTISALLSDRGFQVQVDAIDAQHDAKNHALLQNESDLRFVRKMARRYGRWFWLRHDPMTKQTTAHFKKPPKRPPSVTTNISINVPSPSVDELDLEWDVMRPTVAVAQQLGLRDKQPIDGKMDRSSAPALAAQTLRDIAGSREVRVTAAVDSLADLQARADAALIEAGWFVRVRGSTTVKRLGALLRAHDVVGLQGVGTRHSGTYVVSRVRHVSDPNAHTMQFELARNAWEN